METSQRKVSPLLGLGIFVIPHIFSWFTLRKGFSAKVRIISFIWLGVMLAAGFLAKDKAPKTDTEATPQANVESRKNQSEAIREFRAKIRSIDSEGSIVSDIRTGPGESSIIIEVTSKWHYEPKGARLQLAKSFHNAWASYSGDPDKAFIFIYDQAGNKIGGSKIFGGVWG